ncbi:hypothetical protein CALVIDRAFT_105545 [Calocera viscosa TUFC12733]|uniref:Secreted protein n=1 Tax=Calocera viscosa (strain TUFC12733) TaxID=1330018 RepID=A0A167MPZ4_CALVF|nr:hypothetical protein CALVIDRAFT_105545 [Calocera viscosa TUFC12733]
MHAQFPFLSCLFLFCLFLFLVSCSASCFLLHFLFCSTRSPLLETSTTCTLFQPTCTYIPCNANAEDLMMFPYRAEHGRSLALLFQGCPSTPVQSKRSATPPKYVHDHKGLHCPPYTRVPHTCAPRASDKDGVVVPDSPRAPVPVPVRPRARCPLLAQGRECPLPLVAAGLVL